MTVIQIAQDGLVGQISTLVAQINDASAEEAKSAYDRMGVAREWAKLQENAAELAERLCWLEAVILRRIGQVDVKCLPGARRAAARHFATLTDEELAKLFADYPARTAISIYNLWARAQKIAAGERRGAKFALGERGARDVKVDDDDEIEATIRFAMDAKIASVRQAAAIIIDEYARDSGSTTVAYVVDEFIRDEMPDLGYSSPLEVSAFRRGLTDAVREAFVSAPVESTVRSWEIPAFITVYYEDTGEWVRVPSEFARVSDAKQMLTLRRAQIASAQRSLERLEAVFVDRFDVIDREGSDYLRWDTTAMTRRIMQEQREAEHAS